MSARSSTTRLIGDHLRAGVGASLLISILIMLTVFVAALVPRSFAAVATAELHHQLNTAPPEQLNLRGDGRIGQFAFGGGETAQALLGPTDSEIARIPSLIAPPLREGVGAPSWLIRSAGAAGVNPKNPFADLSIRLAIDLRWTERIDFVSGKQPLPWVDVKSDDGSPDPIEIALSAPTARAMGAEVGDVLESGIGPYRLAGIYEPVSADDAYWRHAFDLGSPIEIRPAGERPKIQASAFVNPETIVNLQEPFITGTLSAWAPIDPNAYSYADLDQLTTQSGNLTVTPRSLPEFGQLIFATALPELLERTRQSVSATSALIALAASGLLGVLLATYALSIQGLVRRRRSALSLLSARGAAPRQLRGIMVLEAALISLPGSALAILVASVVLPERIGLEGWLAPVALAISPLILAAVLVAPGSLREARQDLAVRSSAPLRWVLEVTVAGAAVVALVLLQRRGLVSSSDIVGIDPLLAATPLLVAATVGLLALRLYPLPVRMVRAMARTRTAPVWEVGSARAVREPAIGAIATLALVIGVTIVVFTTVMISTVGATMASAVRERLGADVQVMANDLPNSLVAEIVALPGVEGAVALTSRGGLTLTDGAGAIEVTVVLADPAALRDVRPDLPQLSGAPPGTLPLLVSDKLANRIQGTELALQDSRATAVGVVSDAALPGLSGLWVITDRAAADELGLGGQDPARVLIALNDDRDAATTEAVTALVLSAQPEQFVASARIVDVRSELNESRAAPITFGLETSLVIVAAGSLLLTMLVVALAAAASASSRNRVVGVLRILGMTPRQVRALVAWEFGPVAAASIIVGTLVGIGLPYLVTSVLDLRAFFGGTVPPEPSLEPVWIALAVGSYAIAIAGSVIVASALGRRFAPASTLKMGEA
ncbi:MAG: FtsX-like permease family protein [Salinibacterium sp.]|nr:FtsX-like permease family protein [Salinibacterium sp.]